MFENEIKILDNCIIMLDKITFNGVQNSSYIVNIFNGVNTVKQNITEKEATKEDVSHETKTKE